MPGDTLLKALPAEALTVGTWVPPDRLSEPGSKILGSLLLLSESPRGRACARLLSSDDKK